MSKGYRTKREAQAMRRQLLTRVQVRFVVQRLTDGTGWGLRLPRLSGRRSRWQLEMRNNYLEFRRLREGQ